MITTRTDDKSTSNGATTSNGRDSNAVMSFELKSLEFAIYSDAGRVRHNNEDRAAAAGIAAAPIGALDGTGSCPAEEGPAFYARCPSRPIKVSGRVEHEPPDGNDAFHLPRHETEQNFFLPGST